MEAPPNDGPPPGGKQGRWKFSRWLGVEHAPAVIRKVVVAVIGTTVLLIGVALLVLPGPAIIVIPIGLGILASEFIWARRAIKRGRIFVKRAKRAVIGGPAR